MKHMAITIFAALLFVLCVETFLYAISIGDYTLINDYDIRPLCTSDLPDPLDRFDAQYDKEMCIYVYWKDVTIGDSDQFKWFYDGELHSEGRTHVFTEPSWTGCHGACLSIRNAERAYMTGWWSVEVYINGIFGMRESFYLQGLPLLTTTSSTSSTTTSYSPGPCMMLLIYDEPSGETDLLRYYRDNVLSKTPEGQALIELYYLWSPVIVMAMIHDEEFKEEIKQMIDSVLPMIEDAVE